jgi:hypothetical protein
MYYRFLFLLIIILLIFKYNKEPFDINYYSCNLDNIKSKTVSQSPGYSKNTHMYKVLLKTGDEPSPVNANFWL